MLPDIVPEILSGNRFSMLSYILPGRLAFILSGTLPAIVSDILPGSLSGRGLRSGASGDCVRVKFAAIWSGEKNTLLRVIPTMTCQDMSGRIFGHILNIF